MDLALPFAHRHGAHGAGSWYFLKKGVEVGRAGFLAAVAHVAIIGLQIC